MPPVLLLAEWAGRGEPPDALAAALGDWPTVAADDARGRAALWAPRERMAEAIARVGIPHKLDVTLPLGALAAFTDDVRRFVAAVFPDAQVFLFGHLGDGNLHVNVVGPAPDDAQVDDVVLELVASSGGSISAEHGIGRAKAAYIGLNRSAAELAAFAALQRALDPTGILNPGVVLPQR
jgi:FAD/FMN-containing dehydrogenase